MVFHLLFYFLNYLFQYILYNQKEILYFPDLQHFWWAVFSTVQYVETLFPNQKTSIILSLIINRTKPVYLGKSAEVVLEHNHFITRDVNQVLEEEFDGNLPFQDLKFLWIFYLPNTVYLSLSPKALWLNFLSSNMYMFIL